MTSVVETPKKLLGNFFPVATSKVATISDNPVGTTSNLTITNQSSTTVIIENNQISNDLLLNTIANIFSFKNGSSSTEFFFISKSKGNLYQITSDGNKRLTNTTILGIKEAIVGKVKNNKYLILRNIENNQVINSFGLIPIPTSTNMYGENEINLQTIDSSAYDFSPNPTQDAIFYLTIQGGLAVGYTNTFDFKSPKIVLDTPFSEWVTSWPEKDTIAMQTKPSANVPGYLYFFSLKNSTNKKILGNVNGLTTLISPGAKKILYSKTSAGRLELYLYDVAKDTAEKLGISTLPEKCAWINQDYAYCAVPRTISIGAYPDIWYQGQIGFTDDLWLINTKDRSARMVMPIKGDYDLINLTTTTNGNTVYAINKKDNSFQPFNLPIAI